MLRSQFVERYNIVYSALYIVTTYAESLEMNHFEMCYLVLSDKRKHEKLRRWQC